MTILSLNSCEIFTSYTITGKVIDKYSNEPIKNIRVNIIGYESTGILSSKKIFNENVSTDSNGNYSIEIDNYYDADYILLTANYMIEYESATYYNYYNNDLDTKSAKKKIIKLSPRLSFQFFVINTEANIDSVEFECYYQKNSWIPNKIDTLSKWFFILKGNNLVNYKVYKDRQILKQNSININFDSTELTNNYLIYTFDLSKYK
jgi:hypothetical protein